jgi:hypothetical protein
MLKAKIFMLLYLSDLLLILIATHWSLFDCGLNAAWGRGGNATSSKPWKRV